MIDEDAGEAVADGLVQQDGSDRRVDTARESQNDAVVAQLCLQFGHGAVDERCSTPLLARTADVDDKIV